MILFTLLAAIAIILLIVAFGGLVIGGSAFIMIFADLIVCVAIIVWIIKRCSGHGKRK